MKLYGTYELCGRKVTVITEEEIECVDGRDEFCMICNMPAYPNCKDFCPRNKKNLA